MEDLKKEILIQILNKISNDNFDWTFSNQTTNDDDTMKYDCSHVQSAINAINQELSNFSNDALFKIKESNFKIAKYLTSLHQIKEAVNHFYVSYKLSELLYENKNHIDLINKINDLGNGYYKLGMTKKAFDCYQKSHCLIQQLSENDNSLMKEEYAKSKLKLGIIYLDLGNYEISYDYLSKGLGCLNEVHGFKDHEDIAKVKYYLAKCYNHMGDEQKSINLYIESYEITCRLFKNSDNEVLARSIEDLAYYHSKFFNYNEALSLLMKSLQMKTRIYQNDMLHPSIAELINKIAVFYARFGRDFESLEYKLKSYDMLTKIYGNIDEVLTAQVLNNIGVSLMRCGFDSKALEKKIECFEMRKRLCNGIIDIHNRFILQSIISIGNSHLKLCEEDIALNEYFSLINPIKSSLYIENQYLLQYYMASYYGIKMDYEKCYLNAKEAYDIKKTLYKDRDEIEIAYSLTQLSIYYEKQFDFINSLEYEMLSYEMKKRIYFGIKIHPNLAHSLTNLSIIYQKINDFEKSLYYELESCKMKEILLNGKSHPMLADSYVRLSILYTKNDHQQYLIYSSKANQMRSILFKNSQTVSYLKRIKNEQDLILNDLNDYCSRNFYYN